jgi:hypothetical protein
MPIVALAVFALALAKSSAVKGLVQIGDGIALVLVGRKIRRYRTVIKAIAQG